MSVHSKNAIGSVPAKERLPVATVPRLPAVPDPPYRCLRAFAVDPNLSTSLATAAISEVTIQVPWEHLAPGPAGEYIEVIDVDPASGCFYAPVQLDDVRLLAQNGLPPSEGTPQFHQQMAYAVARLTISNFEHALGRKTLWRPQRAPGAKSEKDDSVYVPQLRIYPHALREANAYYSPKKIALLLGYFHAEPAAGAGDFPGGMVFTCLSHDIVAHETTHALLDGMHRKFATATNPDVLAFHEAFADIVALLQHFTFPEILAREIAATRGDIQSHETLLAQLAGQFGRGTGLRGALRDAIGRWKGKKWTRHDPDPAEYEKTEEPHERGALLVAAVFDAFVAIYNRRTADLLRLATGGTGVLQPGAVHPDLVGRLSREAAKTAHHVLTMCIRALDYCPPVDITFGEYLRAIISADCDLVEDDDLGYRVAFVEAFRRRGLFPPEVRTMSVESLLWRGADNDEWKPSAALLALLRHLREPAERYLYAQGEKDKTERNVLFLLQRESRGKLHDWLKSHLEGEGKNTQDAKFLGLEPGLSFEVHALRFALRSKPDGGVVPQVLITVLQDKQVPIDPTNAAGPQMTFEGGATIVADLRQQQVRYCIRKNLQSATRLTRQQGFALSRQNSIRATYLGVDAAGHESEPFALLHREM